MQHFVVKIQESNVDKKFLVFSGIGIFFLSAIVGYILLYLFSSKQPLPQHILSVRPTIIQATQIPTQVSEVTQDTKIALSLDVPPLYKNWQWNKEANNDGILGLKTITVDRFDQNYLTVPLIQGDAYTTTNSVISNPDAKFIDNYYSLVMQKAGWLIEDHNPYLVFKSFRLRVNIADSSCGGR